MTLSLRYKAVLSYCVLTLGIVLLLFVAPLSLLPGYIIMGILFGLAGLALMSIILTRRIPWRVPLFLMLAVALLTFFTYGLTCRGVGLFRHREGIVMEGVLTIDDAVAACDESGLQGWDLVAYAQNLTARKFSYSRYNPWDSPAYAFRQGQGYCMQQAQALEQIYRHMGISCRLVYADKCRFRSADLKSEVIISHAWLRVSIAGEEKDVCPGNAANRPGVTDFEVLSRVKNLYAPFRPLAHIAFVLGNITRDPRTN